MMVQFSKREKGLLVILVLLLVVTGFWHGILQSELEEWMDLKEALEQEVKIKQEMEAVFEEMDSRDVRMEQIKTEFLSASDGYYGWMSGHEVGREMVNALDESRLHSDSMTIDEPKPCSENSLLSITGVHGLAAGTKEAVCCFLEWVSQNKSAGFVGFRVMPQKEGEYWIEYDVEFYMIREKYTGWRD